VSGLLGKTHHPDESLLVTDIKSLARLRMYIFLCIKL